MIDYCQNMCVLCEKGKFHNTFRYGCGRRLFSYAPVSNPILPREPNNHIKVVIFWLEWYKQI